MEIKVGLSDSRNITHDVQFYDKGKSFEIKCDNGEGQEMGYVNFAINKEYGSRQLWLYKIKTYDEFQHQGVGSALITALEFFAYMRNISVVDGKFYPDNEFAAPFYEKYGYSIYHEDYFTGVGKRIDFEKFEQETLPNINTSQFEILDGTQSDDVMGAD